MIGGGKVALRKVKRLLEAGADVEVMSRSVCRDIEKLGKVGNIAVKKRQNQIENIGAYIIRNKFFLIAACTDNPDYNREVARVCREAGVLVNSATEPETGDVFFGAESGTKYMWFAVSTGGRSPLAARWFARWAVRLLPRGVDDFLENLHKLRVSGVEMGKIGAKVWRKAQGMDWIEEIRRDGGKKIIRIIESTAEESGKKHEEKE